MAKLILVFMVVCALIASVVCNAEQKAQIHKICQEKTKVSNELIDGLKSGSFPVDNKELKCYIGCAMEEMKFIKDAKLDKAATLQMIETMPENLRDDAKKALEICAGKFDSITDPCEFGWEMVGCWKKENPSFAFA